MFPQAEIEALQMLSGASVMSMFFENTHKLHLLSQSEVFSYCFQGLLFCPATGLCRPPVGSALDSRVQLRR